MNDVVRHLTGKSRLEASKTVNRLIKDHLELIPFLRTYSFGVGRPNEVMDAEGILMLIMVLPGLRAGKFRQTAARLICRYMSADITLADEILERNKNPEDHKWVQTREKGREARNHFTDAIQEHGGEGKVYAFATDKNNLAITGESARQLKVSRGVKNPRDGFSISELAGMALAESLEADQIDIREAHGNNEILKVVDEIAPQVGALVRKHGRKERVTEAAVI